LTARSNPDHRLAPLTSSSTRLKGAKSSFGCELNGKLKKGLWVEGSALSV
jgi:hypothetical protein